MALVKPASGHAGCQIHIAEEKMAIVALLRFLRGDKHTGVDLIVDSREASGLRRQRVGRGAVGDGVARAVGDRHGGLAAEGAVRGIGGDRSVGQGVVSGCPRNDDGAGVDERQVHLQPRNVGLAFRYAWQRVID